MRGAFAATIGCVLAIPAVARAESPAVELTLTAPAGCATRDAFTKAVQRRAGATGVRWREATAPATADDAGGPGDLRWNVTIVRAAGGFHGELRIGAGDAAATRALDAASCDEVATGLALVAAVSLTERAGRDADVAPSVPPPVPPPPPASAAPGPSPAPESRTTVQVSVARPPPRWGFGAEAALVGAGLPVTTFGAPIYAEVSVDGLRGSPSFRVEAVRLTNRNVDVPPFVSASFVWTYAQLEACPLRYAPVAMVEIRPCAVIDAGIFETAGLGVLAPRPRTQAWVAAGALARARVTFWSTLFLEVGAGAVAPITRPELTIDPGFVVYAVPALFPMALAGMGVTL